MALLKFSFTLSNHYKGYKAFPIVVYGDKDAEANNEHITEEELHGATITFMQEMSDNVEGKFFYLVFINNKKIGTIFDREQNAKINMRKIESVYAKLITEKSATPSGIIDRQRIRLFVKEV